MVIGKHLQIFRKTKGYSQMDVSKKLGISRGMVAVIEGMSVVPIHYLKKIDAMFGGKKWRLAVEKQIAEDAPYASRGDMALMLTKVEDLERRLHVVEQRQKLGAHIVVSKALRQ